MQVRIEPGHGSWRKLYRLGFMMFKGVQSSEEDGLETRRVNQLMSSALEDEYVELLGKLEEKSLGHCAKWNYAAAT